MLDVLRAIARQVKGAEAGSMLASKLSVHSPQQSARCVIYSPELMPPEVCIRGTLVDPVCVHPVKQVISAEGFKESTNIRSIVRWDKSTIR